MNSMLLNLVVLKFLIFSLFLIFIKCNKVNHEVDPNGYIIFCLCMGRIGNQIEHLLGGMDFARRMNRTLILPSFRTYSGSIRNVPFDEWFDLKAIESFHRVILADDFMRELAPSVWPEDKRYAFCWSNHEKKPCRMKEGNPFGPFWDGLKVDFVADINFHSMSNPEEWSSIYPPSHYPVIALRGAPAPFPMRPELWPLQQHLVLSQGVQQLGDRYIDHHFPHTTFIGIHLRNGEDWQRACKSAVGSHSFMASPQCLHPSNRTITKQMCLPSKAEVLWRTKELLLKERVKVIFVATDQNSMRNDLTQHLSHLGVRVFHADPDLPLVDWAILLRSDFFIGNCISSFSSFVKRSRDIRRKPSSFWGFD